MATSGSFRGKGGNSSEAGGKHIRHLASERRTGHPRPSNLPSRAEHACHPVGKVGAPSNLDSHSARGPAGTHPIRNLLASRVSERTQPTTSESGRHSLASSFILNASTCTQYQTLTGQTRRNQTQRTRQTLRVRNDTQLKSLMAVKGGGPLAGTRGRNPWSSPLTAGRNPRGARSAGQHLRKLDTHATHAYALLNSHPVPTQRAGPGRTTRELTGFAAAGPWDGVVRGNYDPDLTARCQLCP